ncbi:S8 family peptidase [Actinoplanes sp. CA-142083]|uniref:S8 family peptidase n=1 Tax=Actinoplanes sp. CA-142083 TaxID=3239903 RepID=UPI003D8C99E5
MLSAATVGLPGRATARQAAWKFPEHRSTAQLAADRAHAVRQMRALSGAPERARQILDRLQARQAATPGVPFDRYRNPSGAEVLVARGQLSVSTRGGALPSIIHSAQTPAALRERGIDAAPHLIVPLGYVIKADDHPHGTEPLAPPTAVTPAPVRVALVDTGIAAAARNDGWLARAVGHADPLDIMPAAGRLDWGAGHGTFTAGIVQRVAPRCEIVAYRFTGGDGLGTDTDVATALLAAAADGHRAGVPTIINASLGSPAADGTPPPAMRAAVEHIAAAYPDVLIVAAAGNMGNAEPVYPAAFDQVVAVGALTDDLQPAPFSSRGPWLTCSTVGVGVVSPFVAGVYPPERDPSQPDQTFGADAWAMWTGTSFAAPQISGAVARLCYEQPGLTPRAALELLLAGRPHLTGHGRVLRLLPGTPTA